MKCPDCNAVIKQTQYDPAFEWYECPKCGGCFTYAEIIEAEEDAKAKRSNGRRTRIMPAAKGKKRQAEREADANLENELLQAVVKKKVRNSSADERRHRDELPTGQVVNIMADEIVDIYSELGSEIDEMNARDKALILWRELNIHGHVTAREQAVPMVLCGECDG